VLTSLHARGFGLALDDFGTGFASLMRLQPIPFDEMIIDREFIGRASNDSTACTILESAIDLSHKLGLQCTCEGIENEAHIDLARKLKTDFVQGYHIGKPMSADELLIWLEDYDDGVLTIAGIK